jgi:hypothetical protein
MRKSKFTESQIVAILAEGEAGLPVGEVCRKRTGKRCWSYVPKKTGRPVGEEGRTLVLQLHQGLKEDGLAVPLTKLCHWFGVPRRTVYYKPVKSKPKIQRRFAEPVKKMIDEDSSFGFGRSRAFSALIKMPFSGFSS